MSQLPDFATNHSPNDAATTSPSAANLFRDDSGADSTVGHAPHREVGVEPDASTDDSLSDSEEESDGEPDQDGDFRDLAIAAEPKELTDGEVTSPPSNDDQDETARILTEAVESGASSQEIEANAAGEGPNVPPLPPTEPFSSDKPEERDSDMHQP